MSVMKYKCLECETEFEAKMYVQCPKCGEQMKVQPIYSYQYGRQRAPAKSSWMCGEERIIIQMARATALTTPKLELQRARQVPSLG